MFMTTRDSHKLRLVPKSARSRCHAAYYSFFYFLGLLAVLVHPLLPSNTPQRGPTLQHGPGLTRLDRTAPASSVPRARGASHRFAVQKWAWLPEPITNQGPGWYVNHPDEAGNPITAPASGMFGADGT